LTMLGSERTALMHRTAAQEEPRLLGTVENKLGMEGWLREGGHE
jgi:hypothetical protein